MQERPARDTKVVQMKAEAQRHPRHVRREGAIRRRAACSIACSSPSAAGRTRGIPGLDRTRVQVDERGFIVVDEQRRTARAVDLRDRRRRRRADARAQGVARGARRGRGDCGRERRVRAARDSGRRLHRSRARVGRPDRSAGREGEPRASRSRSSRGARRAARSRSIARTA